MKSHEVAMALSIALLVAALLFGAYRFDVVRNERDELRHSAACLVFAHGANATYAKCMRGEKP